MADRGPEWAFTQGAACVRRPTRRAGSGSSLHVQRTSAVRTRVLFAAAAPMVATRAKRPLTHIEMTEKWKYLWLIEV